MCNAKPALRCLKDAYNDLKVAGEKYKDVYENPEIYQANPQTMDVAHRRIKAYQKHLLMWDLATISRHKEAEEYLAMNKRPTDKQIAADLAASAFSTARKDQQRYDYYAAISARWNELTDHERAARETEGFGDTEDYKKAQKRLETLALEALHATNTAAYFGSLSRGRMNPKYPDSNSELVGMFDYIRQPKAWLDYKGHTLGDPIGGGRDGHNPHEQAVYDQAVEALSKGITHMRPSERVGYVSSRAQASGAVPPTTTGNAGLPAPTAALNPKPPVPAKPVSVSTPKPVSKPTPTTAEELLRRAEELDDKPASLTPLKDLPKLPPIKGHAA